MNRADTRIECFRLAVKFQAKFDTGECTREEVAELMAKFCEEGGAEDDAMQLKALRISIDESNRRWSPETVIDRARDAVKFATPKPVEVPEPAPQKNGGSKRTRKRTRGSR